jgi:kelch-like protein 20
MFQDICCEFLKKQLDASNCLGIRAFADTHACRDLLRIADKFTQHNFSDVVESDEFLMLPMAQLIEIISSEELNVRSEEQVFNAIMAWIRHDVSQRRQFLSTVCLEKCQLFIFFCRYCNMFDCHCVIRNFSSVPSVMMH